MSTVRVLPLGLPVAAAFSLAGYTVVVLLSLLALLVMALAMRALRGPIRAGRATAEPRP